MEQVSPIRKDDPQLQRWSAGEEHARLLPAEDEEDPGLREIIGVIRRRRRTLYVTVIPSVLLAAIVVFLLKPLYTAEALVIVESQEPNLGGLETVVGGLTRDEQTIQSEVYVLGSRIVAERVIDRLGLTDDPELNPRLDSDQVDDADVSGPAELELRRVLAKSATTDAFLNRLEVAPIKKSHVISVSFTSEEAEKAALIVNALSEEYILARIENKFESTKRANLWIDQRVDELRASVAAAEESVEAARQEYGLVAGSGGASLGSQQLVELNSQIVVARSERAELEAKLRQVRRLVGSPDGVSTASDVLDSPLIQRLRGQEIEVERRLAELSAELGDRHPRMVRLRAEIDDLRSEINAEVNKIVVGLENQVSVVRARERSLGQSLASMTEDVAASNQNEIKLRALEREAEANRALLANLMGRQKETLSQEDIDFQAPDARVISPADVPPSPSYPNKKVIIGLVFVASAFLGLLIILVRELLDNGYRAGEELERATGIPWLGFVPKVRSLRKGETLPDFITERPGTAFSESLRTLNWSLGLTAGDNRQPRVVLITSSNPGEGKTSISTCLAMSQAEAGQKVMIIDADMRKPAVNELMGINREPGLVELLSGQAELSEVVVEPEGDGPSVIPAGKSMPTAPSLLGSSRFDLLLEDLVSWYDLIIVDSPPVMAGADARIISQKVDATVVVVRWSETRREVVKLAIRQLAAAGAKLAGTLLNQVDPKKHAEYSYGDSGVYTGDLEKYYAGGLYGDTRPGLLGGLSRLFSRSRKATG